MREVLRRSTGSVAPKGHMGRDRQGNGEARADDRRKAGGDAHHPEPVAGCPR